MDPEASRNAQESMELAFQMSNILETGLDRRTLPVLVALCEKGLNPESLAALVKELRRELQTNLTATPAAPTFP
ncbi:hypothetical protein MKX03_026548 [Papaver bracteatum]|nr:hypothetical protein MKX03_026548 [Papaver bracteatum]